MDKIAFYTGYMSKDAGMGDVYKKAKGMAGKAGSKIKGMAQNAGSSAKSAIVKHPYMAMGVGSGLIASAALSGKKESYSEKKALEYPVIKRPSADLVARKSSLTNRLLNLIKKYPKTSAGLAGGIGAAGAGYGASKLMGKKEEKSE